MKNYQYLFFVILTLFVSCDVQNNILVTNKNKESVTVQVSYNKKHHSDFFKNYKNIDFLNIKQSNNSFLKMVSCDTLKENLSFSFKLEQNDTLRVDKSRGLSPNYSTIDSISIVKQNSKKITLTTNSFEKVFVKSDNLTIYNIE